VNADDQIFLSGIARTAISGMPLCGAAKDRGLRMPPAPMRGKGCTRQTGIDRSLRPF
jgi:hypothetical protein